MCGSACGKMSCLAHRLPKQHLSESRWQENFSQTVRAVVFVSYFVSLLPKFIPSAPQKRSWSVYTGATTFVTGPDISARAHKELRGKGSSCFSAQRTRVSCRLCIRLQSQIRPDRPLDLECKFRALCSRSFIIRLRQATTLSGQPLR